MIFKAGARRSQLGSVLQPMIGCSSPYSFSCSYIFVAYDRLFLPILSLMVLYFQPIGYRYERFFYHHSLSHSLLHFVLMEIFRSHDCNGGWKLILPEGQKRFKWFTPTFQYRLTLSHLMIIILLRRHAQFLQSVDIIFYQNFQE